MLDALTGTSSESSALVARSGFQEVLAAPRFRYDFVCKDKHGKVMWTESFENLVTTAGKNDLLDKYFAGSGYTAAWYLGLVDGGTTPTYNAADTSSSHSGWTENVAYSNGARPTLSFSAASGGSKATSSAAVFNINGTATIAGAFTSTISTKSGTTGIIYSEGSFSGNRSVQSGDTLNVSITLSV